MKKYFLKIGALIFLLVSGWSYADDRNELINKAHEDYFNNRISDALSSYQILLGQGLENGTLYYNLGNIYFRLGKNGQALQYYEKALREIPRDKDLRANIQFVRDRIGQKSSRYDSLAERFFLWNDYLTLKELASFFIVFWVLLWGFIYINRIKQLSRLSGMIVTLFICNILMGSSLLIKYVDCIERKVAIVIIPEVDVHPNFLEVDKILVRLREGVKVRVLSEQVLPDDGKWLQIEFDSQNRGWVKATNMGII